MKRFIIPVAAFIAGMAIVPSVFADGSYGTGDWSGLKSCLESSAPITCSLSGDITVDNNSGVEIKNNIVLDLNNHKLYNNQSIGILFNLNKANGSLTIKGGEIVNENNQTNGGTIYVRDDTKLNVMADATISGVNPVVVRGGDPEVTIAGTLNNNVKGAAGAAALWVHGDADNSTVTLTGTTRLSSTVGAGLFQTGAAKTTANPGAVITGQTGIAIKAGELTLNGATVTGNGTWNASASAADSGYNTLTGAAIQIEGRSGDEITIDIDNSIIESENGSPLFSYSNQGMVKSMTIDNSYLKAKDAETPLHAYKAGDDIKWTAWAVDGDTTFNLAEAKGELGTMPTFADEGEENENPNTADTIATYLTIAAVALLGLGATAFVAKKSNR